MFVQNSVEIDLPLEEVLDALTGSDRLEVWARAAYRRGERLAIGPGVPAVGVELEVGEPLRSNGSVAIPLSWKAAGGSRLFPRMEAEVVLDEVGTRRTKLTFLGSYRPPLAAVGQVLDRLALHRVAEATVRNLMERLVEALETTLDAKEGEQAGPRPR
ncbi:MAG: hypothetical protein KatS3mg011_0913 [Acidimicrobiia bacterium]|nr:MAG: hypothetical protein KatS3mg011_0913 [Acidimicrobiia bacterium]